MNPLVLALAIAVMVGILVLLVLDLRAVLGRQDPPQPIELREPTRLAADDDGDW